MLTDYMDDVPELDNLPSEVIEKMLPRLSPLKLALLELKGYLKGYQFGM
jgi:hypothetical protein